MTRYYFDLHENDDTIVDEEGMELASLQRVKEEAGRSLAEVARDEVANPNDEPPQELAISVRDDRGPVLKVRFTFEKLRV